MGAWEITGILLMPVTYGFVGWLTNTAALHMMLYPLEFKGPRRPYLGWQGIVPRRATALALKAVQLLTTHVVKVEEFFARIRPAQIRRAFAEVVEEAVPDIVAEEVAGLDAELRTRLAPEAVAHLSARAVEESRAALDTFAEHLGDDVRKVFNFRGLVVRNVTGRNVGHLVEIFQTVGAREFRFIRRSGWVFGGLLGLCQVGLWLAFPRWWTLPIQGAFVGGITNVIALTMIFRPRRERRLLGMRYQGLFLRRQPDVAEAYATLFAERVLDPRSILGEILHRPIARRVVDVVHRGLCDELGASADVAPALRARLEGELRDARRASVDGVAERLAAHSAGMERLIGRAMDVRGLIAGRMKQMPPEEFEPILRSAFQEDEFLLVVLGAVFGALVGLGQGLFMLGV